MRSSRLDRWVAGAIAAVALGTAATGCGDELHDFRVQQLNPLLQRASEQRAQLASTLRLVRPDRARDARVLRGEVVELSATARRIAALRPPGAAAARFRRYTRADGAFLASLSRFADAFASGTPSQQRRAEQKTTLALAALDRAQTDLQHALR